jgi:hypothetical protein
MKSIVTLPVLIAFLVGALPAHAWTWPVAGPVLQRFQFGGDPYAGGQHRGVDVGAPPGTIVVAPASGLVTFAGTVPQHGRTVTIATPEGFAVTLLHLGPTRVTRGASVDEGAPVGTVGPSGDAEQAQGYVHLGVRVASDPHGYVDPESLLPPPAAIPPPDDTQAPDPADSPADGLPADPPNEEESIPPEPGPGSSSEVPEPDPAGEVESPADPDSEEVPQDSPAEAEPAPSPEQGERAPTAADGAQGESPIHPDRTPDDPSAQPEPTAGASNRSEDAARRTLEARPGGTRTDLLRYVVSRPEPGQAEGPTEITGWTVAQRGDLADEAPDAESSAASSGGPSQPPAESVVGGRSRLLIVAFAAAFAGLAALVGILGTKLRSRLSAQPAGDLGSAAPVVPHAPTAEIADASSLFSEVDALLAEILSPRVACRSHLARARHAGCPRPPDGGRTTRSRAARAPGARSARTG